MSSAFVSNTSGYALHKVTILTLRLEMCFNPNIRLRTYKLLAWLVIYVVFVISEITQQMTHLWCDNNSDFLRIQSPALITSLHLARKTPVWTFPPAEMINQVHHATSIIIPYEVQKSSLKSHTFISKRDSFRHLAWKTRGEAAETHL